MKVKLSRAFFDGFNLYPANEIIDLPEKYKNCLPKGAVIIQPEGQDVIPTVDNTNRGKNHRDFTKR